MSVARHTTLLCAALALCVSTANAQFATSHDSSSAASSATESSSSTLKVADDGTITDTAGLTGKSGAEGSGGQYDNKSSGGRGGILSHLTYEAGGGFNAPTSNSSPYVSWGGNFTVGGGYRFSDRISLLAEYQFIDDKLPGAIIAEAGATGGNDHIWSLTLAPVVDLMPKSKVVDVYVTGGGGFYRKVTNFTDPEEEQYCEYYYCGIVTQNVVVGHFSSNQGGWNVGGGISHRFAGWDNNGKMKVFAEARYLDVDSPAVTTEPNGLGTTTVGPGTKIIPVSVGVRW
jgi:hypothetical protein